MGFLGKCSPIVRRHIAKSNMDGLKPFRINPPNHGLKPRGLRRVPSVIWRPNEEDNPQIILATDSIMDPQFADLEPIEGANP